MLEDHFAHPAEEFVEHLTDRLRLAHACDIVVKPDDVAEHHRDVPLLCDERAIGVAACMIRLITPGE